QVAGAGAAADRRASQHGRRFRGGEDVPARPPRRRRLHAVPASSVGAADAPAAAARCLVGDDRGRRRRARGDRGPGSEAATAHVPIRGAAAFAGGRPRRPVPRGLPAGKSGSPGTRYARSGEVNIAYQVVGDGPGDLVYVPGWVSHVELAWDLPDL